MTPSICPACEGTLWRPWRSVRGAATGQAWRYLRCAGCGLGRLDPFPTPDDLSQVFDDSYFEGGGDKGGYDNYDADADTHLANARARLSVLAGRKGTLVDVGCASGFTLEAARAAGWNAVGVELSPAARDRARDKGFRVEEDLAALRRPGADLTGTVDVVCFFQVLEHIPDPVAALREAAALLRPGGTLLCETWDGSSRVANLFGDRWQQLSPPSVLWVFDSTSMTQLLSRADLRQSQWRRTSKLVSVGLVAAQAAPRLPQQLARPVSAAAKRVAGVRLRYALGDLVAVDATKETAVIDLSPDGARVTRPER